MRRTVAIVLGLVVAAAAFLAPLGAPAAAADAPAEQQFVDLINQERRAAGLGTLAVRPEIVPVARTWTSRMIAEQRLFHNPDLGSQLPSDWTRFGENVGYGQEVGTLHTAFMNSPGHRANVLGDFTQVGVGVDRDSRGRLWVTVNFIKSNVPVPTVTAATTPSAPATGGGCGPNQNPAQPASPGGATGYYVLGSDGGIFAYGNAPYAGSVPGLGLRIDAVLMTLTPSQNGYWIAGRDGGIFSFGDAEFFGSVPGLRLGVPVTAIDLKPTPSGKGYWILGADGGIFSFGDAKFFGSLPGIGVRNRAVRLVPTVTGNGYWILGADGGIFSFGDAPFYGSVPGLGLCESVRGVQLSPTLGGSGYYIVSDRGRVFAFGDAPYLGDPAGHGPVARDIQAVNR